MLRFWVPHTVHKVKVSVFGLQVSYKTQHQKIKKKKTTHATSLMNFFQLTSVQVTPDRYESQVKSHVSHRGVRFKDGNHSQLHEHEKHWMIPVKHLNGVCAIN